MIETELGVTIKFSHKQATEDKPLEGMSAITTCRLTNGSNEEQNVIGKGRAFCVTSDQFKKEVGRRISLTRALTDAGLEKLKSFPNLKQLFLLETAVSNEAVSQFKETNKQCIVAHSHRP